MKLHCVEEYDLPAEILNSTEAEIEADAAEAVNWAIDQDRLIGP